MFELFAAFFIGLFVVFGVAAVIGHVLLFAALLQPHIPDKELEQPPRLPAKAPDIVRWRRAA